MRSMIGQIIIILIFRNRSATADDKNDGDNSVDILYQNYQDDPTLLFLSIFFSLTHLHLKNSCDSENSFFPSCMTIGDHPEIFLPHVHHISDALRGDSAIGFLIFALQIDHLDISNIQDRSLDEVDTIFL